ncbi:MAG: hypothetical protein IH998_16745 [Proteobacteria bacterium]|nr:hypothetical protein [Pseudomonadota bacterium]
MIIMLLAALVSSGGKIDRYAEVGGARYRVTVKGDEVTVTKKALVSSLTLKERDAQRQAVKAATGCEIVDELPNSAKLKGKLSCPPGASIRKP